MLGLTFAASASAQDVWLQNYFGPASIPRDSGTVEYSLLINNNSGSVMPSQTILVKAEAVQKNPDADVNITMCGNQTVNEGSCPLNSNLFPGSSWNFGSIKLEAPGSIFPTNLEVKFSVSRAGDTNHLNDSISLTVPFDKSSTDLGTSLDPGTRAVTVGDTVPYTLTTTAQGEDTVSARTTVEVPDGVTLDEISDPDCVVEPGDDDLTCALGDTPARTINFDATFHEVGTAVTLTSDIRSDSNQDPDPANDQDSSVVTVDEVPKARPPLTTRGGTSVDLGQVIKVDAILGDGASPSGEIVFAAYGPDDLNCSGTPAFLSTPVTVTGSGEYPSPAFKPTASGTYRWISTYSGDERNEPAASGCGESGSLSTVTDRTPICPAVKLDFSIETFKANRRGVNRQVPGLRIQMTTGAGVEADITPSYRYRVKGEARTAKLKARTIRVDGKRRMLFGVPRTMARQLRKTTGRVARNRVTFELGAVLRFQGAPSECDQNAGTKKLTTRISGVNVERALRRIASP